MRACVRTCACACARVPHDNVTGVWLIKYSRDDFPKSHGRPSKFASNPRNAITDAISRCSVKVPRYTRDRLKAVFRNRPGRKQGLEGEGGGDERGGMGDRARPVDYRERAERDRDTTKKYPVLAAHAANCRIFNHLTGQIVGAPSEESGGDRPSDSLIIWYFS